MVRRSYVLFAIMILIGSLSASVFFENGTVSYVGADAIITFTQSGSITVVNQTLYNVTYFVVGGGGAGGVSNKGGGGGGGGGAVEVASYTMTPATYAAVVGAGAARAYSSNGLNPAKGGNGGTTTFGTSTVLGGGGGAGGECGVGDTTCSASTGGSGGGGNGPYTDGGATTRSAGAAGSAYGESGANGYASGAIYNGGGGGGSASNGTNGTQPNGGNGKISSITSGNYGGGGGGGATGTGATGGAGGVGGGGLGGVANSAIGGSGTVNGTGGTNGSGGGGGGAAGAGYSGGGGSGIVIVKMDASYYPLPGNSTGYLDYCNGTVDSATAITWVGYDILTGNQTAYNINVDLQQVYNMTLLVENFTGVVNDSSNFSLCMFPANGTAYAQMTDTLVAPNAFTVWVSHEAYTYSNSTKIYENWFLPFGNNSKLVQVFVVDNTYTPMTGVAVKIQQISPVSGANIVIGTFPVDAFGSITQGLQPATQLYHFSVQTLNGTLLQDFANKAIPCSAAELVCSLVLVVNPNALPIDLSSLSGSCSYSAGSRVISCTGADASATITSLNLTAFTFGNTSVACSNFTLGASGTVACTLPNVNGTYNGFFFGVDPAGYNHLIASGSYTIGSGAQTSFGRDGFLAAVLVVVVAATLMTGSLAVSIIIGCFGLFVALAFGLLPAYNLPVVILIAVTGAVLIYRLKV